MFDVQYYLVTAHVTDAECGTAVGTAPVVAAAGAAPVAAGAEPAAGTGRSSRSQPMWLAPVAPVAAGTEPAVRGALVDTSVYLKPTELVDVALDVLARLAPCLNLGVGELRHKDLLDTIGADNRRK